jgi:cell division protein FtsL
MVKNVKDLIVLGAGVLVSAAGAIISDYKMRKAVTAEVKRQRELEDKNEEEKNENEEA